MTSKYLLLVLWIQFYLHGYIETSASIFEAQFLIKDLDLTKFIEFPYDQKCLQIVLNKEHQSQYWFVADDVSVCIRTPMAVRNRNISTEQEGHCQTFLIFAETIDVVKDIFEPDQTIEKQFFPFTRIYFHLENDSKFKTETMIFAQKYLTENALFGYIFEFNDDNSGSKVLIRDILTNDKKSSIISYTPKDLLHPTVDINMRKENFRISLFNCPPFTFYPESADDETIINNMDGTEYRFVQDVTKNWKKKFNFRDFSRTNITPYDMIMDDLSNKSSDMAICSIWFSEKYFKSFDLSAFYDRHCATILVPKPTKLNEATAIYTTLSTSVWLLFLLFFVLSNVLLNVIAKTEEHLYKKISDFTDLTRTVIETINTATSHSTDCFPRGQTSVKIILISWILLSFWLGISYTTIYTSRLASPGYEKPIDTVRQFLDSGLDMCGQYLPKNSIAQFRSSESADYRELGTRYLVYGKNFQYRKQLFLARKCGIYVARTKNYISIVGVDTLSDLLPIFRIMENCVIMQYGGFAFQKHSPFTKLFSSHIRRYQEHGIIQRWYLDTDVGHTDKRVKTIFEDYTKQDNLPRRITLLSVSGAFFLLATGLSISSLVFLIEKIKNRL